MPVPQKEKNGSQIGQCETKALLPIQVGEKKRKKEKRKKRFKGHFRRLTLQSLPNGILQLKRHNSIAYVNNICVYLLEKLFW